MEHTFQFRYTILLLKRKQNNFFRLALNDFFKFHFFIFLCVCYRSNFKFHRFRLIDIIKMREFHFFKRFIQRWLEYGSPLFESVFNGSSESRIRPSILKWTFIEANWFLIELRKYIQLISNLSTNYLYRCSLGIHFYYNFSMLKAANFTR